MAEYNVRDKSFYEDAFASLPSCFTNEGMETEDPEKASPTWQDCLLYIQKELGCSPFYSRPAIAAAIHIKAHRERLYKFRVVRDRAGPGLSSQEQMKLYNKGEDLITCVGFVVQQCKEMLGNTQ